MLSEMREELLAKMEFRSGTSLGRCLPGEKSERHGAYWTAVITPYLTKSLACLKLWIRNLWLARKTQWFFFLGLHLFCDFSWNTVGKIETNKIVSINFIFFFFFFSFLLSLDYLEKEMATHSSVLAWRIQGTEGSGGLLSVGLHRVIHDWSDLAAAAASLDWCLI